MRKFLGAAVFMVFSAVAPASIIITPGPGNVPNDENVLFNEDTLVDMGLFVQGITNQTNTIYNFTGEEVLVASGGQARVRSQDVTGFDLLTIAPAQAGTFTSLIVNLNVLANGPNAGGTVTFDVDQLVGANVGGTFDLDGGENFFRIVASDNQRITSVNFVTTTQLQDVRQVRIGGSTAGLGGGDDPSAIPEPGTYALLGSGLIGLITLKRRLA